MNVSVRSNVRTAEAARTGLNEALAVAFRGGAITGMLVVGLGLLGVAGFYWFLVGSAHARAQRDARRPARRDPAAGRPRVRRLADLDLRAAGRRHLHQGRGRRRRPRRQGRSGHSRGRSAQPGGDRRQRGRQRRRLRRHGGRPVRDLRGDDRRDDAARRAAAADASPKPRSTYPLVLGGFSILASIVGCYFVKARAGRQDHERAVPRPDRRRRALGDRLLVHHRLDDGRRRRRRSRAHARCGSIGAALVGLVLTAAMVVITEYYTGTDFKPVQARRAGVDHGARDQHHRRHRRVDEVHGVAGARGVRRDPRVVLRSRACTASPSRRRRCCR